MQVREDDKMLSTKKKLYHKSAFYRNFEKGNLVSWETAVFDEVNMDSLEVTMDEICVPFKPGYVLMPNVRPFPDHVALCHKMHGETGIIRDEETQAMAIAEGLASVESCSRNRCFLKATRSDFKDLGNRQRHLAK